MKRGLLTFVMASLLAGCGYASEPAPVPITAPETSPASTPTQTPGGIALPATPVPTATATPTTAVAVATAVPPAPAVGTFPVLPFGGTTVHGTLRVQAGVGFDTSALVLNGLPVGTVHAVHIHLGSCANPYGGVHLTVVGLLSAGPGGSGALAAPIAPTYLSAGHYLIVYASPSPQRIVACGNLGLL